MKGLQDTQPAEQESKASPGDPTRLSRPPWLCHKATSLLSTAERSPDSPSMGSRPSSALTYGSSKLLNFSGLQFLHL